MAETAGWIERDRLKQALALPGEMLGICRTYQTVQPVFDLRLYPQLTSTNTQAWQLLNSCSDDKRADLARAGTVVIARTQSAGRGQPGRQWHSEPGGLYLSLVLLPDWPISQSALLPCISAWGIVTALNNLGLPAQIKWPNDIYFCGKKLGGILTETKLAPSPKIAQTPGTNPSEAIIKQAVIGVGINWHNPVPQTGVNLSEILRTPPYRFLQNKINCLEVLTAIVLRGILQGVFFYRQVGSQVFVKHSQKLLTQIGKVVSLDSTGFLSLARPASQPARFVTTEKETTDYFTSASLKPERLANRSGKVVGLSEEGYLVVALHPPLSANQLAVGRGATNRERKDELPAEQGEELLLLRPNQVHIS